MHKCVGWRLVVLLLKVFGTAMGCSDDEDGGLRSFELDVQPYDPDNPLDAAELSDDWRHVEVEIVDAPSEVTAGGDDFPLVLEIHNTLDAPIALSPCPVWEAGMGESSEVSNVEGTLPCDEIGSLRPGERIELRMDMPPTEHATSSKGLGDRVGLGWRLRGEFSEETSASASFTMNGPR